VEIVDLSDYLASPVSGHERRLVDLAAKSDFSLCVDQTEVSQKRRYGPGAVIQNSTFVWPTGRLHRMAKPNLPSLKGNRVLLRAPRLNDAVARLKIGRDAEIFRMYGGSLDDIRPMTADDANRWVQRLLEHDYAWVIETTSLIGHIRLDQVNLIDHRASLAVGIDDAANLGQGLGTEAISLVQHFAFEKLKLHRLSVRVLAYNTRAISAYKKCGFIIEGQERETALVDGTWHDDIMMGVLNREFTAAVAS
jgi:RimJ/RimL family protein N-acetyltransferase